jgi:hypothetical protein
MRQQTALRQRARTDVVVMHLKVHFSDHVDEGRVVLNVLDDGNLERCVVYVELHDNHVARLVDATHDVQRVALVLFAT